MLTYLHLTCESPGPLQITTYIGGQLLHTQPRVLSGLGSAHEPFSFATDVVNNPFKEVWATDAFPGVVVKSRNSLPYPRRHSLIDLENTIIQRVCNWMLQDLFCFQDAAFGKVKKLGFAGTKSSRSMKFTTWRDFISLATTCHYLYDLLTPSIYLLNKAFDNSSALRLSARIGSLEGVKLGLDFRLHPSPSVWGGAGWYGAPSLRALSAYQDDLPALHWAA
ncbi:hypothetical protein BROUX41_002397 [Berkeleyomyces rouxiae]|uniref:uncharacterized protein n=1 Tax=Berkeleyomyces rouxiae TaxID=2035830 RepID=UPI003B7DC0A1